MIKILQVVGKMHYGGMETLIMNIYRNIDREKVQFDFLVHYSEKGEYDDEIKSLGGKIYVMPNPVPQNFFKCKKAYKQFFEEHHEYNKIHVHLHNMAFLIFPEAKKYNMHCIIHLHNNGVEKNLKGYLGVLCTHWGVTGADTLFACSKEAASFFIPKKKQKEYKIIKNGIVGKDFFYDESVRNEVRTKLKVEGKLVLLCVARFAVQKNHEFLIDIVNELKNIDENIKLLLVGTGPLETKIKQKVRKLQLEDKVEFLGARGDVNQLMQAADCYIMPSLWEGLALVYIEAQATGLKVYTSEEALSKEACVSELIEGVSLSLGAKKWAERIYSERNYKRENQENMLRRSGFDIKVTAEYLQEFYKERNR